MGFGRRLGKSLLTGKPVCPEPHNHASRAAGVWNRWVQIRNRHLLVRQTPGYMVWLMGDTFVGRKRHLFLEAGGAESRDHGLVSRQ